mgnify:CR=1 FL=1
MRILRSAVLLAVVCTAAPAGVRAQETPPAAPLPTATLPPAIESIDTEADHEAVLVLAGLLAAWVPRQEHALASERREAQLAPLHESVHRGAVEAAIARERLAAVGR